MRYSRAKLLVIPRVANFSAACTSSGHAIVSLSIVYVSANVTVDNGKRTVGYANPLPGHPINISFRDSRAAIGTVQIAQVGEAATKIATVQIAVGPFPGSTSDCDISTQAIVGPAATTGG
jgi:hypothetical protein